MLQRKKMRASLRVEIGAGLQLRVDNELEVKVDGQQKSLPWRG
jgi:hypothetical protein